MSQRTTDASATWGYNIGGFERRYSSWRIESPDGAHFTAQRKIDGRPRGPRLRARTLDELAALIEHQQS